MDKQQIETKLREIIARRIPALKADDIKDDADLGALGADSLAVSWIVADVEDAFDIIIRSEDIMKLNTLAAGVDYVAKRLSA